MPDETQPRDGYDPSNDRDEEKTNRYTGVHQENNFPGSRVEGRPLFQESVSIAGDEWTVGTLVDLERLRRERTGEWSFLLRSLGEETKRTVLVALLRGDGTYEDLTAWTDSTRRTVRTHVYDLRDAGIVEVKGNPSTVGFVDDDVRLLASDALSFL